MTYKNFSIVSLVFSAVFGGLSIFFGPVFLFICVGCALLAGAFHSVQGEFQAGFHYGATLLLFLVFGLITGVCPLLSWLAGTVGGIAISLQLIERLYPNGLWKK